MRNRIDTVRVPLTLTATHEFQILSWPPANGYAPPVDSEDGEGPSVKGSLSL